jgi:4-amino-4-deoxy-L-arabinose transferase-like glycosyltransferase
MIRQNPETRAPLRVLGLVLLFYVVNNGVWLLLDRSSPSYDKAAHAGFALQFLRLFEEPTRLSLAKLLKVTQYWPPFFHLSSVPVTMVLGFSVTSVAATNFLFLPVAVISIYAIGRRLFDGWVGAWAVVLTLLYPIVYFLARTVLVDFALLAMVALSLNLVLASDGGLHVRRSWGLGLAAGCAMLTKWTAVLFVVGPALFWLARCLRRGKPRPVAAAAALGLAAVTFAVVALPWYVKAFGPFVEGAKVALGSDPLQEGDPAAVLDSIKWYWHATVSALILWPLLIPTLAGLAACLVWRRQPAGLLFLLCWALPPLVFFVLIPNKDARFVVAALPAVAMMAAAGIQSMPWRPARSAIWAFTLAVGILQFYAISFDWPFPVSHFHNAPSHRANWRVGEIVAAMATMDAARPIRVGVLPNEPDFEPNLFILAAAVGKLPLVVNGLGYHLESTEDWSRYDAIVSKTGTLSPEYSAGNRAALRQDLVREAHASAGALRIALWRTWPLPDGSRAEVYTITSGAPGTVAR